MDNNWRIKHKNIIVDFLQKLNSDSDRMVLKGGTGLMLCYGLDRFSEDIDLDGGIRDRQYISNFIEKYCKDNNYTYTIKKDTPTVKRYIVNYGDEKETLKIETSFRSATIDQEETKNINGYKVYDLDGIALRKTGAYSDRDKIRDIYDLCFIANNYWNQLNRYTKTIMKDSFGHKGFAEFDDMIRNSNDALIDADKLTQDFLNAFEIMGILDDNIKNKLILSEDELVKKSLMIVRNEADKSELVGGAFEYKGTVYDIKDVNIDNGKKRLDAIIENSTNHSLYLEKNFAGSRPFKLNLTQHVMSTNFYAGKNKKMIMD